jgi:hypothetical protein
MGYLMVSSIASFLTKILSFYCFKVPANLPAGARLSLCRFTRAFNWSL